MATSDLEYFVDQEIAHLFEKTSATCSAYDTYVKEYLRGGVILVAI
jgi:hypothetical protein